MFGAKGYYQLMVLLLSLKDEKCVPLEIKTEGVKRRLHYF